MRPVNDATAVVPLVLTAHFDAVAAIERHPQCQIDVVRDKYRVARSQLDDEPLMA